MHSVIPVASILSLILEPSHLLRSNPVFLHLISDHPFGNTELLCRPGHDPVGLLKGAQYRLYLQLPNFVF